MDLPYVSQLTAIFIHTLTTCEQFYFLAVQYLRRMIRGLLLRRQADELARWNTLSPEMWDELARELREFID